MKNSRHFISYFVSVVQFAPFRFALVCVLTVANGLLAGVGLVMLVPILQHTGWLSTVAPAELPPFLRFLPTGQAALPLPLSLGIFVLIVAAAAALDYVGRSVSTDLRLAYTFDLQQRLNRAIAQAKWSYVLTRKLQDANHLMTQGIGQAVVLSHLFAQLISESLVALVYLALSCSISFGLTAFIAAIGFIPFLLVGKRETLNGVLQLAAGRRTHELLKQFVDGIKIAQSYNLTEQYINRFERLAGESLELQRDFSHRESVNRFRLQLGTAALFAVAAYAAITLFHTHPVTLITFLLLCSRLAPRINGLLSTYRRMLNFIPVHDQLAEMIAEFTQHRESEARGDKFPLTARSTGIRFEGVSFGYTEKVVLNDVSCSIPFLSTTAIVGRSGSGKTTFVDLLLGLLTPTEGTIFVGDQALTPERVSSWRACVSYVPQEPYLFHESVRANLMWGVPDATDDQIWEALDIAGAGTLVKNLPNQLGGIVGDRGIQISGGERQRLALARALLRKPAILLLDEATNALDAASEALIQIALKRLSGSLTIVMIAHRLSSIQCADYVLVLENGRLVETGPLPQLESDSSSLFSALFSGRPHDPTPMP